MKYASKTFTQGITKYYIIYMHNYLSFLIRLSALMKAMDKHLPQNPFTGKYF